MTEEQLKGIKLYAGVLYKKEIDFVATKRDEKFYIQVSDNISAEETLKREVAPLLATKDAYPKYVLSLDHFDYSREGVQHINIVDFLLEKRDITLT